MSAPIRILQMMAVLELGGSQSMVMNLYRAIDKDKVQFDFIVDHPDKNDWRKEIKAMGGRVYDFPRFTGKNFFKIKKAWSDFFSNHKEYNILHTHSRSYASIYIPIAKRHGLVTIAHSHSTSNGRGAISLAKDIMQLPIRYQADYLFACSQTAGEWLFGKRAMRSAKFWIIPNAIDCRQFIFNPVIRGRIRKELGADNDFLIGHVGRMVPPKNHLFLLEIFAEVRNAREDAKLILIGDGELRPLIEAKARDMGINEAVLFLGPKQNVSDYYQAMDCFVFPSLWEGLGITVIEAQVSGLPCIVSENVPRAVDVVDGLVRRLDLDSGMRAWAEVLKNLKTSDRHSHLDEMMRSGYDISGSAAEMQEFYLKIHPIIEG